MRTLIAIDSVGALDKFSTVFDLDKWKKNKFTYLCRLRYLEGKEPFATDNAKFVRFNGKKVPCYLVAVIVYNYVRARRKLARILRKIFKR